MNHEDPKRTGAASPILDADLGGDPLFNTSWTKVVARPFLVVNPDGSVTFTRPAADPGEEDLYLRILGDLFLKFYRGNGNAHYTFNTTKGVYAQVDRGITLDDVLRHLRGIEPALLAIPVTPEGRTCFGLIDADRHNEGDISVDHVKLAQLVTMHDLSLIVAVPRVQNPRIW